MLFLVLVHHKQGIIKSKNDLEEVTKNDQTEKDF